MDFMFSDPTMLDDLDFLYKSDTARKLMFYYQVMRLLHLAGGSTGVPDLPCCFFIGKKNIDRAKAAMLSSGISAAI